MIASTDLIIDFLKKQCSPLNRLIRHAVLLGLSG